MDERPIHGAGGVGFTADLPGHSDVPCVRDAGCTPYGHQRRTQQWRALHPAHRRDGQVPGQGHNAMDRAEPPNDADGCSSRYCRAACVWRRHQIPRNMAWISTWAIPGPSDIFSSCTAPDMMDICRDAERYCPTAIVATTNPMAMLCACYKSTSVVSRSVPACRNSRNALAKWIGAPDEIRKFSAPASTTGALSHSGGTERTPTAHTPYDHR